MDHSQLVEAFGVSLRARRRSARTVQWYGEQFAVWAAWAAAQGLGGAIPGPLDVDRFLAAQAAQGLAPATVRARFVALRALYKWAVRRRLLDRDQDPIALLDPPAVPRTRRPHVTPATFGALMASIPGQTWIDHRDSLILGLLYYSGLRLGEVVALQAADLDPAAGEVIIRLGKGGKARAVPTAAPVIRSFVAYRFTAPPGPIGPLLWASDCRGGIAGPLTAAGLRQMLKRRFAAAGLAYQSPHQFRHGFAIWLLNAGARMSTVSAAMGHSDQAVTAQVYAFTLDRTVRAEYDHALNRLVI